ncbi:MAG TPA: cytochrome c oxidase accessory protein CcoG [Leucothrix sp.]|nr:cytochrome c oxidase accessory protein CcoG [Leucothrix sp.]
MSNFPIPVVAESVNIHPRSVKGRFRSFKSVVLYLAYAVYFILPWIPWSRPVGDNQAVQFDMVARKFYIFDLVVYAQDIFWLAALLFLAAVLLFFSTALVGRAYCGYFCFQTLWTDAFREIEKLIQGDRVKRVRLDKQSWGAEKIFKKGLTFVLWATLAIWTGLTFVLFWGYAPELAKDFFTGNASFGVYGTALGLGATTFIAAGLMREKVCEHVCPYARFQSVMIDKDSLIPTYDLYRGEGKSGRAKPVKALKTLEARKEADVGDCVDCNLCVQVCPVGIDIRDGMQYSCIQCGLCIDACDTIMDARGWDRGLIRYESENGLEKGKTHFLKLRTYGYGLAVMGAIGFLVFSMSGHKIIESTARQIRSPLYVTLSNGHILNKYELKVVNKSMLSSSFDLTIKDLPGAKLDMGAIKDVSLRPDERQKLLIKVRRDPTLGNAKSTKFQFVLTPKTGEVKETIYIDSQFITP